MTGCYLTALILGTCGAFKSADAQCSLDVLPGAGVPGVDGTVYAMTTWDPDGNGPIPEVIVIGGSFRIAGDVPTINAAAWDGHQWIAMNRGLEDQEIRALVSIGGQLFAGGSPILTSMPSRIMKWDVDKWQTIGVATRGTSWSTTNALGNFAGDLIVGGLFSEISGVAASSIARWDGKSWHSLDAGMGGPQPQVFGLGMYNGELIACGQFQSAGGETSKDIAAWNGTIWRALNPVTNSNGEIYSVCNYDGDLVAAGRFWDVGGVSAHNIARWDGEAWAPIGNGLTHSVLALTNFDGLLIAGGEFHGSGSVPARGIASWNGSDWAALDVGVRIQAPARGVLSLAEFKGELLAGGYFNVAGGAYATSIAAWNGSSWRSIGGGLMASVFDWTVFGGKLIVASFVTNPVFPYGGFVGAWTGDGTWEPVALRITGDVRQLAVYKGGLVAGGSFSNIDGFAVAKIAQWTGNGWSQLGSGIPQETATIYAMQVYEDELYVAGGFMNAGGVPASNIARWDGSTWRAVGSGTNGIVLAMTVFDGQLIAAGLFTSAGGLSARHLAKWDGYTWSELSFQLNGSGASALGIQNQNLIVGGSFDSIAGVNSTNIIMWDGENWLALGDGLPGEGVRKIMVHDNQIFAGGVFYSVGQQDYASVARWDGSAWHPVGEWLSGPVQAMANWNGELFVGGDFPPPYEGTTANYYFARWGPTCALGDMNCDDLVDLSDVEPFIAALLEPSIQDDCTLHTANMNSDVFDDGASRLDGADIAPFVAAVIGN